MRLGRQLQYQREHTDGAGHGQAFVATWRKGKWKKAEEVPGLAKLNKDGAVYPGSLSCATAGNCVAAGAYLDGSGHFQVFEVIQRAGTWRTAVEVPGEAKLNVDGEADVYQVACASPGNCALAGYYRDKAGHFDPFTAELAHALHLYLARSATALAALQIEDLLGMTEPVNVPGTDKEYPNWQRKVTADIEDIAARADLAAWLEEIRAARG